MEDVLALPLDTRSPEGLFQDGWTSLAGPALLLWEVTDWYNAYVAFFREQSQLLSTIITVQIQQAKKIMQWLRFNAKYHTHWGLCTKLCPNTFRL